MKLNDKLYAWIKWFVVIVLPACGTLWTALSKIWPLPYADEIPATILAVCTFLGAVLCISTAEYYRIEGSVPGKHEDGLAMDYGPETLEPVPTVTETVEDIIAEMQSS